MSEQLYTREQLETALKYGMGYGCGCTGGDTSEVDEEKGIAQFWKTYGWLPEYQVGRDEPPSATSIGEKAYDFLEQKLIQFTHDFGRKIRILPENGHELEFYLQRSIEIMIRDAQRIFRNPDTTPAGNPNHIGEAEIKLWISDLEDDVQFYGPDYEGELHHSIVSQNYNTAVKRLEILKKLAALSPSGTVPLKEYATAISCLLAVIPFIQEKIARLDPDGKDFKLASEGLEIMQGVIRNYESLITTNRG